MYVDFDGTKYGTDMEVFVFKPFDGQVLVKDLEAYPLKYFVKHGSNDLVQRGRKFVDLTASPCHMWHAGITIGETKEECNGPVVIDLKLAFTEYQKDFPQDDSITPRFKSLSDFRPLDGTDIPALFDHSYATQACLDGPYCYRRTCGCDRYNYTQLFKLRKLQQRIQDVLEEFDPLPNEQDDIDSFKDFLENNDLIELLPGSVPGFSLRNRVWVQLNLDQLNFIEQQDDWNKLALPKGHREIVQAMVETHSFGSKRKDYNVPRDRFEMDLVRGKGNGCIILLHGVPGVGKTSTAGDVGYEPEDVERNMGKHFKLANRWGCVLLLDEADVFLAKRNKTDVKRNGLVSVFLRILEYYSGILFLTTNRVGAIDDAFRSRLHLTLYYPKLTETQTLKIWKTNFQRLKENNKLRLDGELAPIDFNDKKIIAWVKKHWEEIQWNGRQIRNAFQTAVALSEFEAKKLNVKGFDGSSTTSPVLTTDHFKKLARASAQFSEYLRETHGDDEDERAVLDRMRAAPTRRKVETSLFSDNEDESDVMSDSRSGSDLSGASGSGGLFGSGSESSDVEKKSKKKGKKTEGGRSHSRKVKKGKRREEKHLGTSILAHLDFDNPRKLFNTPAEKQCFTRSTESWMSPDYWHSNKNGCATPSKDGLKLSTENDTG
ncbi:hypothetical protein FJTKL_02231 [Diaporthe vaccinii]|uniref:AAA+ ATPase domain-containing protein n=1 Tax=Diaporthe vaccinii TaxID=105482 RepID=A0ABR4F3D7_9PEZI